MGRLFIIIMAVTLAEIAVIIKVGSIIGAFPTILLMIATAIFGSYLLRQQGGATLRQAQLKMASGQMPAQEMLSGMALVIGGVLLVTPGFLTDLCGLALLLPASRQWLGKKLMNSSMVRMQQGGFGGGFQGGFYQQGSPFDAQPQQPHQSTGSSSVQGNVIEGEVIKRD